ncbi:MAG: glycine betaine ABC transporter substrate-binding protein [Rubrobacteraceae bacterium]
MSRFEGITKVAGLTLLALALAVGCGGGGGGGEDGLSGAEITVGSKEFTEQEILGQIALQVLENEGATVNDQIGLAGTEAVRTALESGDVDLYWEYVGTGWINHLGESGDIPGENDFQTVAERDLEENQIEWIGPAAFSNGYAIATNQGAADELGITALSEMGPVIEENGDEIQLFVGAEFATRDDGLPGVEETYGWEFPNDRVRNVQDSLVYQQTAEEGLNFGSVFETDGRIPNLNLVLLEDDEDFFPSYDGAITVRQETLEEYPELEEVFTPIMEELTTDTMQELNARRDVDEEFPEDIAEDWLTENGFLE